MPFTSPFAGDVHVDVPLTNFSQKYLQMETAFVGMRAFPNLPVSKQSDRYYVFDRDQFYRDEATIRADGTETQGGGFTLSTETYFADVYGFHKLVSDRQRSNQDAAVNLDESSAQYVTHKLLIARERAMANTTFTAAAWPSYTAPAVNWSGTTDDPIINVRTAIREVHENTGYRPNKALIGRQAYDTLLDNDAVLARITGGSTADMPANVMRQLLATLFELQEIYVMDSVFTSTVEGAATTTRSFIGGDNMLIYYAPDSVGLEEPSAVTQFSWTGYLGATEAGLVIRNFREEGVRSDKIEGEMAFEYKITGVDLGYIYTGVST